MFTIGAFLILLGFLFDEGTTFILFLMGWEVLETNPIYVTYGLGGWIGFIIIGYMFFLTSWRWVIKINRRVLHQRFFYRKWYDLVVFMFCFIIVSIVSTKIITGYNHLNMIVDYKEDPVLAVQIDEAVLQHQQIRETQPAMFKEEMIDIYETEALSWSYWQVMFNAMMSFLLFKVGYKTVPWDLA